MYHAMASSVAKSRKRLPCMTVFPTTLARSSYLVSLDLACTRKFGPQRAHNGPTNCNPRRRRHWPRAGNGSTSLARISVEVLFLQSFRYRVGIIEEVS